MTESQCTKSIQNIKRVNFIKGLNKIRTTTQCLWPRQHPLKAQYGASKPCNKISGKLTMENNLLARKILYKKGCGRITRHWVCHGWGPGGSVWVMLMRKEYNRNGISAKTWWMRCRVDHGYSIPVFYHIQWIYKVKIATEEHHVTLVSYVVINWKNYKFFPSQVWLQYNFLNQFSL